MPVFEVDGVETTTPPEGVVKKVQLSPELEKAILENFNRNRDDPNYQEFLAGDQRARNKALAQNSTSHDPQSSDISPARARLLKMRQTRIEAAEIQGETWYLKRMTWPESVAFFMLLSRDDKGNLAADVDPVRSMSIALLCCAVASGHNDPTPYFSREDAIAYVDEPGAGELVAEIHTRAQLLNSHVLKTDEGEAAKEVDAPPFSASDGGNSTPTIATQSMPSGNGTENGQVTADLSSVTDEASEPVLMNSLDH